MAQHRQKISDNDYLIHSMFFWLWVKSQELGKQQDQIFMNFQVDLNIIFFKGCRKSDYPTTWKKKKNQAIGI